MSLCADATRMGCVSDSAEITGERLLAEGAVVETSGSTGRPKRVRLSGAAFTANSLAAADALGEPGRWVLTLPTHYVAGMNVLARAAVWGTEPIVAVGGPRFSAMGFAAVTPRTGELLYVSLVPIQLQRLMDSVPGLDALRRYRRILLGGQAPDPALIRRARQEGVAVTITYGSSETCGGILWDGRPIGDAEYRLVDGVVHLTGASLADGYVLEDGSPDVERDAEGFVELDGRRWHRTKDFGEERSGRLFVLGRIDDLIVSGGIKVSLLEVQFAARAWPGLGDAVAVAVDRPGWGQAPAIVTTGAADLDALRAHVEANLGAAARPVRITTVDEIPMLSSGKPDLPSIRALLG